MRFGDGQLFLPGQRHAVFVDGQRDDRRAVALRHRQNFRRALLAILQVDGVDDGLARNALQRLFDHVGFGGVDGDGRGHAGGNLFQDVADVGFLVLAHDGAAQVEHVRAFIHQLLGQREDAVIVLRADHVLEVLDARGGVHLLGHNQRLGIEVERHHGVRAGRRGDDFHIAPQRLKIGASRGHRLDMFVRSPAASADNAHAVLGDELLVIVGELLRLERVDRATAPTFCGNPAFGSTDTGFARIRTQITNAVVHLLRPGGAVHADDGNVEHLQRSERRADLGAQAASCRFPGA